MRWVNRRIKRGNRVLLGAAPIAMLLLLYLFAASSRHADNPNDKILPMPAGMAEAMSPLLFQPDQLSGQLIFWADTFASLQRLGIGLGISTLSALLVGLVAAASDDAACLTALWWGALYALWVLLDPRGRRQGRIRSRDLQDLVVPELDDGREERPLAGEVVVEQRARHPRLLGDLIDLDLVVGLAAEGGGAHGQQVRAAGIGLQARAHGFGSPGSHGQAPSSLFDTMSTVYG